jgi:hypothetical protein
VAVMMRRVRQSILEGLDRCPPLSRLTVRLASSVALHRGADPAFVSSTSDGRPLDRILQVLQWSLALVGAAPFPRHFQPGDHFTDRPTRLRAAAALRDLRPATPEIRRQLISVDDALTLDALKAEVAVDLRATIAGNSRGSGSRPGVNGQLQERGAADVTRALESVGVRPFLMSGTLLGVVREGNFMDHDYDVDLGLLPGEDVERVVAALRSLESFEVIETGPRICVRHDAGVSIDVFPHTVRDDLFWHATFVHEWWNTPFELERHRVGDNEFWIPDDPDRYLDENYGRWSTRVPFYDMSFDTPNRNYVQDHVALRFLHSRCLIALRTGNRWLLESAARELRDAFGVDATDLLAPSPLLETARRPEVVDGPATP